MLPTFRTGKMPVAASNNENEEQLTALWKKPVLENFIKYAESKSFLSATIKSYLNS